MIHLNQTLGKQGSHLQFHSMFFTLPTSGARDFHLQKSCKGLLHKNHPTKACSTLKMCFNFPIAFLWRMFLGENSTFFKIPWAPCSLPSILRKSIISTLSNYYPCSHFSQFGIEISFIFSFSCHIGYLAFF